MGKSSKQKDDDVVVAVQKPKLQAVLLADPFLTPQQGKAFKPLTLDGPKMLCPLNNMALIEHSLDFVATQGVEQVFVVCTQDEMEEYLQETKKMVHFAMELVVIKDTSLTNAGDALRELYKRNVVQSDPFLLLFGDCITNMDLGSEMHGAMKAHLDRRSKDSASLMTIILKEKPPSSPSAVGTGPATDDLIVGLDSDTNRVLQYDNDANNKTVKMPCSFFKVHSTIEIRDDLMDTGVCICSPDVLGRFEDEFDYLHISQDFVHNSVAEEEEGLQTRIHAHVLPTNTYAARVLDEATYHSISSDLLRRWCYPVVPDNYHQSRTDDANSLYAKPRRRYKVVSQVQHPPQLFTYREITHPSKVGRNGTITGPGMLGCGGSIAEGANVLASVVGNDVYVHDNATIQSSHLWDNVEVGANATIIESIVSQDCVIGEGALVKRGCVLGKGVVIGKGAIVPEFTRITLQEDDEEDEFGDDGDWGDDTNINNGKETDHAQSTDAGQGNDESPQTAVNVVGKDGSGHVWVYTHDEDDESDDEEDLVVTSTDTMKMQSIGYDPSLYWSKREEYQAEPEDDGLSQGGGPTEDEQMDAHAFSMMTDDAFTFEDIPTATTATPVVFGRQKGVDVVKEMKEICLEFEETSPMENLAIELNSYKFSQNAAYSDCTRASTLAMVDRLEITADMKDGKLVSSLKARLEFWGPLLQKMSIGIEEEKSILYGLEQVAIQENSPVATKLSSGLSFRFVLQTLHDEEVLSEEAILSWAAERKEEPKDSAVGNLFQLKSIQEFLEWLEEEDEEDSDDDSDESGSASGLTDDDAEHSA
ncbi:unnamed protein product [Cylindrotheca closterium]|uniref:Translation initiation factor eIF2B subunit epsilon n=1 Tax=Cylindrotheca closterium TaxID=2856 RepID=A0AAD2CG33_9STRA|nr:unnamed protein product [Cylindrotheca closterium]